jgi:ATP-dependent RNA helicase DeaD
MPQGQSKGHSRTDVSSTKIPHQIPTTFAEMGLNENTLKSVLLKGFETPTPIQAQSIPLVLEGYDLLAQAQTGTGKTAAFALPVLSKMDTEAKGIQIVVLTPTRELAQQVAIEFEQLGKCQNAKVATIVGGKSYTLQRQQLKTACTLVATPGRLHDLLRTNSIANFAPTVIILDEADRMLDMGFSEDLEAILEFLPEDRQTLLFSATFPRSIMQLSKKMQKADRKIIQIESKRETNENIEQQFIVMKSQDREEALFRWIDYEQPQKAILFCEMKRDADHVGAILARRGYLVRILHGDTEQRRREEIMRSFRTDRKSFLVATDIAARGLDVLDVTHVINFQLPRHIESYVHRVGRTGRAGQSGNAISFVSPSEVRNLDRISKITQTEIKKIKIPTLTQLREKAIEKLMEQIREVPLDETINYDLSPYLQDQTQEVLTKKLIQMHLGERFFTGVESIEMAARPAGKPMQQGGRPQQRSFEGRSQQYGERSRSGGSAGGRGEGRGEGRRNSNFEAREGGRRNPNFEAREGGRRNSNFEQREEGGFRKPSFESREEASPRRSSGFEPREGGRRNPNFESGGEAAGRKSQFESFRGTGEPRKRSFDNESSRGGDHFKAGRKSFEGGEAVPKRRDRSDERSERGEGARRPSQSEDAPKRDRTFARKSNFKTRSK